ncbi:hypothetical protein [Pinibacter aurantiacus]|uniref:Uncharacterized protein n=1 Tax=Pinibacter aurantiacus TaxID=2851599 RepID=A0A9E2W2Q8_9BACT|nr:hypothetical protein [Pinibacter aurantiacus]MBV4357600.1 hypothetical protein [Pinibacter aurantiacus]
MTQVLHFNVENGNSKTTVVEDATASNIFWSDYFTKSYVDQTDHFPFKNSFDLMGRPLEAKKLSSSVHSHKSLARKVRRSKAR